MCFFGCTYTLLRVYFFLLSNVQCTHSTQLGAVVHKDIGPEITHVVAKKAGTDKMMWAEQNGRFVVHLNWLIFSGM